MRLPKRLSLSWFCAFLLAYATSIPSQKDVAFDKDVHFFFYLWYGNPQDDGRWKHWDHAVLPHWTESINKQYATKIGKRHLPPETLHSPYYPLKGPYSSRNTKIILQQFEEMIQAGGNVAVISWWGQGNKKSSQDSQGINTDLILHELFSIADTFGKIKIMFHLEPYPGRNIESIRDDIIYIMKEYSHYTSFYKQSTTQLPMFYIYDSYHLLPIHWSRLLNPLGDHTIRNTPYDGIFVGLWLNQHHGIDLLDQGGFDGIYTYFASESFSYGSTSSNWKEMCEYCHHHKQGRKVCILSVGPGYNDTRIRPWNTAAVRDRLDGKYFADMWDKAIMAEPDIVSVTSFNEWGEGTQIEPAQEIIFQPSPPRQSSIGEQSENSDNNDGDNNSDGMSNENDNLLPSDSNTDGNNDDHDIISASKSSSYQHYGKRGPYSYLHISAFYAQQFMEFKSLHRSQNPHVHDNMHIHSAVFHNTVDGDDSDDGRVSDSRNKYIIKLPQFHHIDFDNDEDTDINKNPNNVIHENAEL